MDGVKTYLQGNGYKAIFVQNGVDALTQAQLLLPALLLIDIQLLQTNGLEVIQQMRQSPTLAHSVIVALTALTLPGDREAYLAIGADHYISKPLSQKKLKELLLSM
jgi:CheY-like chemotaxis protein